MILKAIFVFLNSGVFGLIFLDREFLLLRPDRFRTGFIFMGSDSIDVFEPITDFPRYVIVRNGSSLPDVREPDSIKLIVCTNRLSLVFVYFLAHTFDF